MKYLLVLPFLLFLASQCRRPDQNYITQFPGKPETPSSIKREHEQLLAQAYSFTLFQDSTGLAAEKLNELMRHHFKEEEDYVLPPLGVLPLLASGQIPEHYSEIIQLTGKLESQLNHLNAEHQLIKAYLDELVKTAPALTHPEIQSFEIQLINMRRQKKKYIFRLRLWWVNI